MKPRCNLAGSIVFVTRRCTQRQFLLRPDETLNNNFLYCALYAASVYKIGLIALTVESDHYHVTAHDPDAQISAFMERLDGLAARSINCLRGRWENFWSSDAPCIVRCETRADVVDKMVYTLTNPVKDGLVDRVHHWPGVNSLRAMRTGEPLRATRPRHFFRKDNLPDEIEMTLGLADAPLLGDAAALVAEVCARVAKTEEDCAAERRKSGRRVLGRKAVLAQHFTDSPSTIAPRRKGIVPRVACRSKWYRVEALQRDKTFLAEHAAARLRWLAGAVAPNFPVGTVFMRHLVGPEPPAERPPPRVRVN